MQSNAPARLSAGACVGGALLLLVLPLNWLCSALIAALFHEGCHLLAIRLCGGKTARLRFGAVGATIGLPTMSRGRELICALAGPIGGLLLLLVARWFPRIAVCGMLQSVYNLLPIYPLDGGRALRCGASLTLSPRLAQRACDVIEGICFLGIFAVGFYGTFILKLGIVPLLPALMVLLKTKATKSSCKPARLGVQ